MTEKSNSISDEACMYVKDMLKVMNGKSSESRVSIPSHRSSDKVALVDDDAHTKPERRGKRKAELLKSLDQIKEDMKRDKERHKERMKKIFGLWYRYESSLDRLSNTNDLNDAKEKGLFLL